MHCQWQEGGGVRPALKSGSHFDKLNVRNPARYLSSYLLDLYGLIRALRVKKKKEKVTKVQQSYQKC